MTDDQITNIANDITVQRLLKRYVCADADYVTLQIAGATVTVEPSRHRSGIPRDAACRRYVVTHVGEGWSMIARAVWRDGHLHEPAATHTSIDFYHDNDGRHRDDDVVVAAAVNRWLQALPL